MGGTCPPAGGNPTSITSGGDTLGTASAALQSAIAAITTNCRAAATAADNPDIGSALASFETVLARYVHDMSLQVEAGASLARNGAADLIAAGGH